MRNPYDEVPDRHPCPECYEEETTDFYVDRETGNTLGCDCCVRELTSDEQDQYIKDGYLYCPVCGARCDDIFIEKASKTVIGCDDCVEVIDAFNWNQYYNRERKD